MPTVEMSNDKATHQALCVPELVLTVINFMADDLGSLYSAMKVNSMWFFCASSVAWDNFGTIEDLLQVPRARRHLYAPYIRSVYFPLGRMPVGYNSFTKLQFFNLRFLEISQIKDKDGWLQSLERFLHPKLEHFAFDGHGFMPQTLNMMPNLCKKLRSVSLNGISQDITDKMIIEFVKGSRFLEALRISNAPSSVVTDDLFVHLSQHEGLTQLGLSAGLGATSFDRLQKISGPFKTLTSLTICIPSNALEMLIEVAPRLEQLLLTVQDNHAKVNCLAKLSKLSALTLQFEADKDLSNQEIASIECLKSLVMLKIKAANKNVIVRAGQLTNQLFKKFVQSLNGLSILHFDVECDLNEASLCFISKYSSRLRDLSLLGTFNLCQLANERDQPKFRHVTDLALGEVVGWFQPDQGITARMAAEHVVKDLKKYFPKLKEFDIHSRDLFSLQVKDLWDTKRDEM